MNSTVVYLKDRCLLSDVPKTIASKLSSARLLTTSGKKVSYCGLVTVGNLTCVFLPRQTEISCSVSVKCNFSPALFKALRLYSQQSDRLHTSDDEGENLEGSDQLGLAYDLLSDYRMNGLYSRRDIHRKTNEGKPNWSRTVAKNQPYLSPTGPIYVGYEGSKSRNRIDSEASRIHAYLIQSLDATYGEAFFGKTSFRDGGLNKPSTISKRYFLAILNGELQKLYSERDMKIFRMLIKLVEKVWGNTATSRFIGTKNFHTIWEHMLKKVISGTINLNDKFSIPTYIDAQGKHFPATQKGQRTDIIIHKEESNSFAIIDAKYYEATSLTTSPGWPDLVKQFFYAKAVESLYTNATIKNYFIFPGLESHFQSVLMADRKDESKTDKQYQEISCIYVNPSKVIEAYIAGKVLHDLSRALIT